MNAIDIPMTTMAAGMPSSRDYERVARAIDYLRREAGKQPSLAEAARHVHLSERHLQRLFTRWAGISPKRFLQHVTAEQAKAQLAANPGVLGLTTAVGLSGPGRLHDLFVALEAMSPGEFNAGGAGLTITYGVHDTPFGPCLVAMTARGICNLQFLPRARTSAAKALLREHWPGAHIASDAATTAPLMRRIFAPLTAHSTKPLAVLVKGTNFQIKVWRALLEIPFGATATYGRIADRVGEPAAARAVGNAVGANPVAYLIPCHRVLRESGALGGYRWGPERKAAILAWEAAHSATNTP